MAKIVCVGLACLDYLFKVADLPQGGGKFFAENYQAAPGGPAAAASIAVAALGHQATFLGRLGDDEVGREIVARLKSRGVNTDHVRFVPEQSSQVSSVVVDQTGERQIINYSSKQLDPDPSWLPEKVIAECDFVLVDVRWPEGAEAALQLARKYQLPSLIDADIAPVDTSELVALADFAVFSERGLEMYTGISDPAEGLMLASRKSEGWVGVTAGEKGCFWLDEAGEIASCPAETVKAVDTCGAGDVFHGAFAVARVENMGIEQSIRFSGVTASLKCLSFGGSLGVPERKEVDAYLDLKTR